MEEEHSSFELTNESCFFQTEKEKPVCIHPVSDNSGYLQLTDEELDYLQVVADEEVGTASLHQSAYEHVTKRQLQNEEHVYIQPVNNDPEYLQPTDTELGYLQEVADEAPGYLQPTDGEFGYLQVVAGEESGYLQPTDEDIGYLQVVADEAVGTAILHQPAYEHETKSQFKNEEHAYLSAAAKNVSKKIVYMSDTASTSIHHACSTATPTNTQYMSNQHRHDATAHFRKPTTCEQVSSITGNEEYQEYDRIADNEVENQQVTLSLVYQATKQPHQHEPSVLLPLPTDGAATSQLPFVFAVLNKKNRIYIQ